MNHNTPEIIIIGASILDVLVRPADPDVFQTGSSPAEEIRMSVGADALNEATVLAKLGKRVRLETIFRCAKEKGKTVCADMTKKKKNETASDLACALQYVDYLFPNDEEAMLLTGKDTVEEAAEVLRDSGAGTVAVKCGRRGCYLLEKKKKGIWIPAEKGIECLDTTGAGDSFAAGFLFALSEGKSAEECAGYGNHCGARAVSVVGATEWL